MNGGGSTTLAALTLPRLSGHATVRGALHAAPPKWSDPPTHVTYQSAALRTCRVPFNPRRNRQDAHC